MENEIKVGEYIRTKLGDIKQITEGFEFIIERHNKSSNNIVKHSSNLIDLIQCGDYVNGYKVTNVINKEPCPSGKCVDIDADRPSEYCTLWEDNIETVVTKEQFESISYKVKE